MIASASPQKGAEDFFYRQLVETSTDLIWAVDLEGRWTFVNRLAVDVIYGYTPEEMLGRPFTDFLVESEIDRALQTFEKVKRGQPFFKYETIHYRKDRELVYLSFNAVVLKDEGGKVLGATGTAMDITERKKAEDLEKKRSEKTIRYQQALLELSKNSFENLDSAFQLISKTVSEALEVERVSIWFFDVQHAQIHCENLFSKRTQTHHKGTILLAKNYPHYFQTIENNLLISVVDALQDSRTCEFRKDYLEPLGISSMMDIAIRRRGELIGVLCHEHVGKKREWTVEDQSFGSYVAEMIALLLEGEERRKAEKALLNKTLELEHSNQELEQFTSIASHDLREPLHIILSFVELLKIQHTAALNPKILKILNRIEQSALRMSHLIEDLLAFAKMSNQKSSFERVVLNAVVDDILTELDFKIQNLRAKVEVGKIPPVYGDPHQLYQLFQNLIANSLKFRKPDVPPLIRIQARLLEDGKVEISVQDNGIGFASEEAQRIFQPFERLHHRHEYEGSGMGLAICKRIVTQHHGDIVAQGSLGEGTVFKVYLPAFLSEGENG